MLEITSADALTQVMSKQFDLVVLDIYADWCGPCKYLTPKLDELSKTYMAAKANVIFCKVKNDLNIRNAQGLPTIEFWLKQGNKRNLVHSIMGADLEEIKRKLNEYAPLPSVSTPVPILKQSSVSSKTMPENTLPKNPAIKNVSTQFYNDSVEHSGVKPKTDNKRYSGYKTFSGLKQ